MAHVRVGVVQKLAEAKDGLQGQALEVPFCQFGGLALELGKLLLEFGVLEPTVEGAAADLRDAGGLGDGGRGGEYGEGCLLARGETGSVFCSAILRHLEPWGLSGRFLDSAGVRPA